MSTRKLNWPSKRVPDLLALELGASQSKGAAMVSMIAPWAELVPGVERRLTADELLIWPEDQYSQSRYELIGGKLIRMVPPGFEHGEVTISFSSPLHQFVKTRKLGVVTA